MKLSLVVVALLAVAAALSGSSRLFAAPASPAEAVALPVTVFLPKPPTSPPRQIVFFGRVKSVTRAGRRYLLKVDPAEFLAGETARRAAVEDKAIPPGEAVPNDYYIRDEGHRLLTYLARANTHVTVITAGIKATPITVSELGQIVKGKNPKNRALFEPKNGFWIRVASDSVLALDQQYTP